VTRTESSKSRTAPSRRYRASVPTALDPDAIADALIENLHCLPSGRKYATRNDWYMALAYTVRERACSRVRWWC
jgi:glycogen phosphorylase